MPGYVAAQGAGAILGVAAADVMFELPAFSLSQHARPGPGQWLSEFVATFGLLSVIWGCSRLRSATGGTVMPNVIFACVHSAGRSQMASAFFNAAADSAKAKAVSAGTEPATRVHPEVVAVMREIGFDLSAAKPTLLTDDLARGAKLLVTMGCGESCPFVRGCNGSTGTCPIRRDSRSTGCVRSGTASATA